MYVLMRMRPVAALALAVFPLPLHYLPVAAASAAAVAPKGEAATAAVVPPNTDNIEECNVPSLSDVAGIDAEQSCIRHDGITRCWYTYIPETVRAAGNASVPLVLDLHGYNLCASQSARYTGWDRVADQYGFIVVYPQGNLNAEYSNDPSWDFGMCCSSIGPPANEGEWPPPANINDRDFLRQLLSNVVSSASNKEGIAVDTERLYFAGHSNGCMMSQAMAALESDLVAAVCCHASSLMVPPADNYVPTSVQVVYGDLDATIGMFFGSNDHILDTWGSINQCTANTTTVADSGLYATHTMLNCTEDTVVETVEVFNVGHFSYLGIPPNNEFTIAEYPGAITPEVDTTRLSWKFCSRFTSDAKPVLPSPARLVPADTFALIEPTMRPTGEGGDEEIALSSSSFLLVSSRLLRSLALPSLLGVCMHLI